MTMLNRVLRATLSILIGAVMALLLAATAQLLLAPLVGPSGIGALKVIDLIVFWAVLIVVAIAVARRPGG